MMKGRTACSECGNEEPVELFRCPRCGFLYCERCNDEGMYHCAPCRDELKTDVDRIMDDEYY